MVGVGVLFGVFLWKRILVDCFGFPTHTSKCIKHLFFNNVASANIHPG